MTAQQTAQGPLPQRIATGSSLTAVRAGLAGLARRLALVARATGGLVGAALDGLLVGLVVGYVAATFASGGGLFLGLPVPLEWLIAGGGAGALALLGAAVGRLLLWVLLATGRLIDRALARVVPPWRRSTRIRAIVARPARLLRSLPFAWIGAFAAVLLVANFAPMLGPVELLLPAAALAPYVMLAGVAAALTSIALRLAHVPSPIGARPRDGAASFGVLGQGRRAAIVLLVAMAVALGGYGGLALLGPGTTAGLVAPQPALDGATTPTAPDDPGAPGTYQVRALSYGIGTDARRAAFRGRSRRANKPGERHAGAAGARVGLG